MTARHALLLVALLVTTLGLRAQERPAPPPVQPAAEKKSDTGAAAKSDAKAAPPAEAEKSPAGTPAKAAPASLFHLPAPTATPTAAGTPPPLSPRMQQVRARINALFAVRNDPPPPPDARLNPFRPAGALPATPLPSKDGTVEPPPTVSNNLALLQQAVAVLRVRGTLTLGKTLMVTINSGPGKERAYKEGDILAVNLSPDPVNLRVRVVTRNSITFSLAEAEMVLKF